MPDRTSRSLPGVSVDGQTSLLVAPPAKLAPAERDGPRCRYREDYLEEDIQTLLSDWMDSDSQGGSGSDGNDEDDGASAHSASSSGDGGRSPPRARPETSSETNDKNETKKKKKSKKKKKGWRKLQWRAPGVTPKNRAGVPKEGGAPPLPPSASRGHRLPPRPKNGVVVQLAPSIRPAPSSGGSVTTASSAVTGKSSSTPKHSNGALAYASANPSSISSGTPPLARYRRLQRKTGMDDGNLNIVSPAHVMGTPPRPPRPSSPRELVQEATNMKMILETTVETSSITDDLEDDYNSLVHEGSADDDGGPSDERSHVTFGGARMRVARNYDGGDATADGPCDGARAPLDEAARVISTAWASACLDGDGGSPTSVIGLSDCGAAMPLDGLGGDDGSTSGKGIAAVGSSVWEGIRCETDVDDNTVSTVDDGPRRPGPVDVDTCARVITPDERRHLRAMHQLGHAHLRSNELGRALEVFAEIVRGQRERHGRKSVQTAVAMHNLGVVCARAGRYSDAVKSFDSASKIRTARLGKDSLEVAESLGQRGVALMELNEYEAALSSFVEALRIRRKASHNVGDGGGARVDHRPAIVRLLNSMGCALFETDKLEESRSEFEEALHMQREQMKEKSGAAVQAGGEGVEDGDDDAMLVISPRDACYAPLGIALTLANLGSIHLRQGELDESLACLEEALLIQESVLGEDHRAVADTRESISFVLQSMEGQEERMDPAGAKVGCVRIAGLAGVLSHVGREGHVRGRRAYGRVRREVEAAIDAASYARCDGRPLCADGDAEPSSSEM